ncbi:MAG TPA: LPS export ABC transporter periplasmic protein LptC [Oxalobacteraceae bacterium]|jgi:lipopolysaccharide export system protein LptC|nr:LPS export ABC transporter periplasmic protein LptC [Oxalobacteraceae bacterium]HCN89137.1 LPS export ABC transporter periplasmic protein LptC [Oxalobacteraceae bacterium]
MNHQRASDRFRLVALIAVATTLALGSLWLFDVMRRSIEAALPAIPRTEPDYTVENFNLVRLSKTGLPRYNISGTKLTHYPQADSYEIEKPMLKNFGAERPPLTLRAERALADPNDNKIQLYDNVQMDRPASSVSEFFHLKSDYLLVLPDDDVMQTDKAVDITLGTTHLTGVGMFANDATREFRLAGNVHGQFQPARH